jgi:hypothetical protein
MIGAIFAWAMIGIITMALGVMAIAPFILSGKISEQEERNGQP